MIVVFIYPYHFADASKMIMEHRKLLAQENIDDE